MINTGLHYSENFWEHIRDCNPLKEKNIYVKQQRAFIDATMERVAKYNTNLNRTIKQFKAAYNENLNSITPEKSYLFIVWQKYMDMPGRFSSKSNKEHHLSAFKNLGEYISEKFNNQIGLFLIQNIDKEFLEGFLEWYTNKPKGGNSINSAFSYLRDLKVILGYSSDTLNIIKENENPFYGINAFKIVEASSRAKEYTLSLDQLTRFLKAMPKSDDEQKAKDIFTLCFCMSGLRINDLICLEKNTIKESMGEKYFDLTPMKSKRYGKRAEIKITSYIQKILDKYPGQGRFVLDCLPLESKLPQTAGKNYYRSLAEPLKSFSNRIEGIPELSWSYARFSVNHYLLVNDFASRDQIAEMLVHSPKTSKGYFNDVENKKFKIQDKLSEAMDEQNKDFPLDEKS
tara:strand:+ start:461 stop:1660 length:1200 start_codon:yes stop_codon:yes gene_type:complete